MRILRWLSMSCGEFELRCGADPAQLTLRQRLHVKLCGACRRYSRDMRQLDARIREAMRVSVAPGNDRAGRPPE